MKYFLFAIIMIVGLFLFPFLFYGMIFPAKNFLGCYVNRSNTKKICINSDNRFGQFVYKKDRWENFHSSIWSSIMMKDVAGEFAILSIELVRTENDHTLQNVTLQPYKDLLGRTKIRVYFDTEPYDEYGEIFEKL